jgi:hypothetical protein
LSGWTVTGLSEGESIITATYQLDEHTTLTATLTLNSTSQTYHLVTFNLNGGMRTGGGALTQSAVSGGSAVAPTVARSGYSFAGWDRPFSNVTSNLTVTALWTPAGGNNNNGGGGGGISSASLSITKAEFDKKAGGDITITLNRSGYSLSKLTNGSYTLKEGTDYTVSGNTVTIKAAYLMALAVGEHIITFDMSGGADPRLTITVKDSTITDVPESISNPFMDVKVGNWFYDAVMYAYANGLMAGTSTNPMRFSPNVPLTRGMIVTILYRHAGSPDVSDLPNPFDDVQGDIWYTNAVKWAAANGIVAGYGGGKYGPNDNITRQDLAAILHRYADFAGIPLPIARDYRSFLDDADIADYAKEAIEAFFRAAVINGYPDGGVHPKGEATRAEVAAMLMRFLEAVDSIVYRMAKTRAEELTAQFGKLLETAGTAGFDEEFYSRRFKKISDEMVAKHAVIEAYEARQAERSHDADIAAASELLDDEPLTLTEYDDRAVR